MRKHFIVVVAFFLCAIASLGQGVKEVGPQKSFGSQNTFAPFFASAPAVVQPTTGNPILDTCTNYATHVTCAYPINVTSGNEAYVFIATSGTSVIATPTCSSGTATIGTFTAVGAGSSAGGQQQWYRAAITGSGSCTVSETITGGTSQYVGVFPFEVSNDGGVDSGTNPVYNSVSCFGPTTCNNVSITTSTANDLLLYVFMGGSTAVYSALTPYSVATNVNNPGGNQLAFLAGSYVSSTATTVGGTYTVSNTVNPWNSVIAIK